MSNRNAEYVAENRETFYSILELGRAIAEKEPDYTVELGKSSLTVAPENPVSTMYGERAIVSRQLLTDMFHRMNETEQLQVRQARASLTIQAQRLAAQTGTDVDIDAEGIGTSFASRKITTPTARGELVLRFARIAKFDEPDTFMDQLDIKSPDNVYNSDGLVIMRSLKGIRALRMPAFSSIDPGDSRPEILPSVDELTALQQGLESFSA